MALRIVSFIAASLPVVILTAAHFAYTSSVSGIGTELNEIVLFTAGQPVTPYGDGKFAGPFSYWLSQPGSVPSVLYDPCT